MKIDKKMLLPLSLAATLLLAACGGGGGGGGTSASTGTPGGIPTPTPTPQPTPPPEPTDITDRIPPTIDPTTPADPPAPPVDITLPDNIEPLTTPPPSIPTTRNSAAFQRIRLGDAYARAVSPTADAAAVPLTGAGMTIGIMEEVNHFHPELAANIDTANSILTSPYPADAEQPDDKFIIPAAEFARYPAHACYLQFGIDCPDDTGNTKYFLRMEDDSLRLIPGLEDTIVTIDGESETSEFGVQHGTGVASIAAADMDEANHAAQNLYGIAHEAKILVYARPVGIAGLTTSGSEHPDYFRNAPAAADVYNFSHVYDLQELVRSANRDPSPVFSRDLAEAIAENGIPLVVAAGNDGYAYPQFPAALPLFHPQLRGQVIAVAALNSGGSIASSSNRCGRLPANWNSARHGVHYCLAAPGTSLHVADYNPNGTPGYDTATGTSFAAPIVSGAVAILKQFFRSNITDRELVLRLLHTANRSTKDSIDYSNEAIYGAGLLDLEAATRPVSPPMMEGGVTMGEASYSLEATRLALSPAFGDALAHSLAATEFAAFDALGAPFWYPATDLLAFHSPRMNLSTRLAAAGVADRRGEYFGIAARNDSDQKSGGTSEGRDSASFVQRMPSGSDKKGGWADKNMGGVGGLPPHHPYLSLAGEGITLATPALPLGPGHLQALAYKGGFVDEQTGASFGMPVRNGSDQKGGWAGKFMRGLGPPSARQRGEALWPKASAPRPCQRQNASPPKSTRTSMHNVGWAGKNMGGLGPPSARQRGGALWPKASAPRTCQRQNVSPQMEGYAPHMQESPHTGGFGGMLSYDIGSDAATLALQLGTLIEDSGPLGLHGEGGFANLQKAETLFTGIAMNTETTAGWRLHAEAHAAATRSETSNSHLLRDLSTITSSAFRLRAEHNNGLSFTLRQPLRVESAEAELSLPIGRSPSGALLRETRALSLTPSGRELDLSASYHLPLSPAASASFTTGAVRHPGHSRSAPPEFYALTNLRLHF